MHTLRELLTQLNSAADATVAALHTAAIARVEAEAACISTLTRDGALPALLACLQHKVCLPGTQAHARRCGVQGLRFTSTGAQVARGAWKTRGTRCVPCRARWLSGLVFLCSLSALNSYPAMQSTWQRTHTARHCWRHSLASTHR